MASVASQLIEDVTAHAQSDSLEDAREICADGTYFPYNIRIIVVRQNPPGSPDETPSVALNHQPSVLFVQCVMTIRLLPQ